MEMRYHHITSEERIKIETLRREGFNNSEIARRIGKHRSSIARELERNFAHLWSATYKAREAERRCKQVRHNANKTHRKIVPGSHLEIEILRGLSKSWSPEQIAGRLKKDNNERILVCHETIYRYIYYEKREYIHHLRQGHKRRYRRRYGTKIREKRREELKKKRIDARPKIVEKRERLGDWEGDTIVGQEKTTHLLTYVDRKSGYLLLNLLPQATAQMTRHITTQRFASLPKTKRHTITYDNGVQFAEHQTLERDLKIDIYFAHQYRSWERGTNENTNGLVRQFYPKRSPFKGITKKQIKHVEKLINTRPRKRLGYATPQEVFLTDVAV